MHDSTPVPPDPESERRGHELRDVAIKPILYFLIGLFVFGGALQGVMSLIMQGYITYDTRIGVPSGKPEEAQEKQKQFLANRLRDTGDLVGDKAPLQRDTTNDMLRMYKQEDDVLTTYRKDEKTGQIRVPIDRAIEILAKKGLPHRDTPKALIDKELPYPQKTRPYMSTQD
jgi:hypothetical protein